MSWFLLIGSVAHRRLLTAMGTLMMSSKERRRLSIFESGAIGSFVNSGSWACRAIASKIRSNTEW